MITFSKLGKMGRLGNQLFQVAAALATAEKNNMPCSLPLWEYSKYFSGPFFHSGLAHNAVAHEIQQQGAAYDPIEIPQNTEHKFFDLLGYFQSQRFFEHRQNLIRRAFSWRPNHGEDTFFPTAALQELALQCTEPGCHHVAIHVRRGDYLTFPDHFPPLPIEYYQYATGELANIIGYGIGQMPWRIHVFSDDIEWCKKEAKTAAPGNHEVIFHEHSLPNIPSEIIDLYLMSHCQHFIIANSSFGWWGAWLATNPGKVVIAPHHSKWFGPKNGFYGQTQDVIPKTWKQIEF